MILTVALNAAIDRRYIIDDFQIGKVNRVKKCTYVPGGKGLNVAKPLAISGADVIATGFVGGHAGSYIENALIPFGIKSEFYHLKTESRSCINIWDNINCTQTELLEPGFTLTNTDFKKFTNKFRELVKKADVVTLSGSVPKGLDGSAYQDLIKIVKDTGKKVILDTSGDLLKMGIQALPTMIKPNIDEIRMLTGSACTSLDEIIKSAKKIHKGGIKIVVISLGSDGSLVCCEEGIFRAIVPSINTVNTVGCGDSMIAGFALGLSEGLPIKDILQKASAISAASAMSVETGYYTIENMNLIYPQIQITKLE